MKQIISKSNMNNSYLNRRTVLVILVSLLCFSSCKYEDGPALSLRSKRTRAANIWTIDKVFENGVDKTEDYKNTFVNYKMVMHKNLIYTLTYRPFNLYNFEETGTWGFNETK